MTERDLMPQDEERLSELLRAASRRAVDEATDNSGRQRLLTRVRGDSRPSVDWASSRRRWTMGFAFAGVLALAAVTVWQWPTALSYEVVGTVANGDYLSAPTQGDVDVRFSDGSVVRGLAGSRLRIASRTAHGARLSLERGETHYQIVHDTGTDWSVVAGPYEVRVTGTRFELNWDPDSEVLLLRVRQGSVEVSGPMGATPIAVGAGQGLHGDVKSERLTVFSLEQPVPSGEVEAAALSSSEAGPNPEGTEGSSEVAAIEPTPPSTRAFVVPKPTSVPTDESWTALVAKGDFDAVLTAARARGVDQCLSSCSAGDLSALGDAARYNGQTQLALKAIQRSFERFGSSNSAFLMGRTLESKGDLAGADSWYKTYLSRFPSGGLAAEALAGRMRSVVASRGREAAAPLAREYLARYPSGVHTKTAHRILQDH